MKVKIHSSWEKVLQPEFESSYFLNLIQFVKKAYQNNTCYPSGKDIFNCFNLCPFDSVRVVLLGQDPYHNGQANGLAFSINEGEKQPASLRTINKEYNRSMNTNT